MVHPEERLAVLCRKFFREFDAGPERGLESGSFSDHNGLYFRDGELCFRKRLLEDMRQILLVLALGEVRVYAAVFSVKLRLREQAFSQRGEAQTFCRPFSLYQRDPRFT